MKTKFFLKVVLLIAIAAVTTILLCICGMIGFIAHAATQPQFWNLPISNISQNLVWQEAGYVFTDTQFFEDNEHWAMLIDEQGNVVWGKNVPDTVPMHYTLTQVASFTRWYLDEYPVQVYIREDGLFVIGAPRDTTWKYNFEMSLDTLNVLPYWLIGGFLLTLLYVVGGSAFVLRYWFRKEQQAKDSARANWIHGISHDIRTPLSIIMGYASEIGEDSTVPSIRREQAMILCHQGKQIKELVNDLNLTMRLDYAMQPLRKTTLSPAALIRQAAADFYNNGLGENFSLSINLSEEIQDLTIQADAFLLQRALYNLVHNCIQHNQEGCEIVIGACRQGQQCQIWVLNDAHQAILPPKLGRPYTIMTDGEVSHGIGLKLVEQIAKAHQGSIQIQIEKHTFCCAIYLPIAGK